MNPLLQKIGEELDVAGLPAEKRDEMLSRIGGIIYQAVLVRALEKMNEGEQEEFESMLDQDKSPEELFDFLVAKVPNFSEIVTEEVAQFKKDAVSTMQDIESA